MNKINMPQLSLTEIVMLKKEENKRETDVETNLNYLPPIQ